MYLLLDLIVKSHVRIEDGKELRGVCCIDFKIDTIFLESSWRSVYYY